LPQHDFARKRGSSNASSAAADTADSYGLAANGGTAAAAAAAHQAAELQRLQEGMDLVMRTYERELKKPLRNLVGGELVRALLIQVRVV
jgi:nuclear-control-of-ATPase protein 2